MARARVGARAAPAFALALSPLCWGKACRKVTFTSLDLLQMFRWAPTITMLRVGWGAQTEALSPLRSMPLKSGEPERPSSTSLSCETFSWCGTEARVASSVPQRSRNDQRVAVGTGAAMGSVMASVGDLMCAMN